ncbi:MAG TPA: SAM-dependent methyltransferase [Bryobacteraceae bacterium]
MTPAGEILAAEIERAGQVSFHRFMEVALYHPQHGYYRRRRDPFGKHGDFYTAEQLQPVFGLLMAAHARQIYRATGAAADCTVVELGAGRGEMAGAFAPWRYIPIETDQGKLPEHWNGILFSNEFFDALPVDVVVCKGGEFREQRVRFFDGRFVWQTGPAAGEETADYLARYCPPPEEGHWYEAGLAALEWIRRIAAALDAGCAITVDYGYTRPEAARFPEGTLMGYRAHVAREDVLTDPGERDITAHVNFTALEECGAQLGLRRVSFRTLARTLLDAGEEDRFASVLEVDDPAEAMRRRMQLKTLLVGMGETFRVLVQRKEGAGEPEGEA